MATEVWTVNSKDPARRWSRPYAITLSDTLADKNLLFNDTMPYRYIQNVGTAGEVAIAWAPDDTVVNIYLGQGQVMEGGLWRHAKTTGTTAGVELIGFLGIEGVDA